MLVNPFNFLNRLDLLSPVSSEIISIEKLLFVILFFMISTTLDKKFSSGDLSLEFSFELDVEVEIL